MVCQLLNEQDKISWKDCQLNEDDEKALIEKTKIAMASST